MTVDRRTVVRAALALLNEVGLDGLTLRRLARQLGVQAPTLYWHIKSKQELLDEMATTMLRDHVIGVSEQTTPWQRWVTEAAHGLRQMLLSYRDGAKVFSGTYITDDSVLTLMEAPLRVLTDAGFTLPQAVDAWSTLYSYVVGFTIEEQAVRPNGTPDPRYQPSTRARRIDPARHPLTHQAGELQFSEFDARFARGLGILVAGLEQSATPPPVPTGRPKPVS